MPFLILTNQPFDKLRANGVRKKQNTITSSASNKIALSIVTAILTGCAAQISLPLPFTPIPISLQTFTVLCAGIFLGKKYGALSQLIYLFSGIMGMPWFSGMESGIQIILGPKGGYIIGFIFSAFFVGYIVEKFANKVSGIILFCLITLVHIAAIYIPGITQLGTWFFFVEKTMPTLHSLLLMGFYPFLPGALLKTFAATLFLTSCRLQKKK